MHTYKHEVKYYECDRMGVTHHSNYVRFMEEARVDYLDQLGFGFEKIGNKTVCTAESMHCFIENGRPVAISKRLPELFKAIQSQQ